MVLPVLGMFSVGCVAEALGRLRREQLHSQRLAIEAERRRIAWELHDSAKQRIHAAHLVLSAVEDAGDDPRARAVRQAMSELQAAAADMDTSLAELRSPLQGRPLDDALRQRASELQVSGGPAIEVVGSTPALDPMHAAHVYRIAAEAMTNAVRHAGASSIEVQLGQVGTGRAALRIADDGRGMPDGVRPGASGLLAMRNRARTIGGQLTLERGPTGRGTVVAVVFPVTRAEEQQT
jgi:two-component system sensor histidine kinase UhpB